MPDLEPFLNAYATDIVEAAVRERRFSFFTPKSIDRFIDPRDGLQNFPLWAKVWEAALVLADEIARIPPTPGARILEIGCGLGVAGIVASAFGHEVTLTEHDPHALAFARANAERNLPDPSSRPRILKLDWMRPELNGVFDMIVGSEVVYSERDYEPLLSLFKTLLQPGGKVLLAEGVRATSLEFFRRMQEHFDIRAKKKVMRSSEKEVTVILCSMTPKSPHH
jgi:predicted nicotinamide N-methyase